ncbi:zinc-dependent metalloprotease [Paenibacillus sp. 481]|uniref:zinc-dependent metalloprotease n=1 Tax=Paenibacillus sp. 481 TaxID=2835869 RepID=UPI001E5D2C8C|nr:zinc-dependent metalloprotease [Paenibacillus sp. 481]UHA73614.1 zinc-dependent metalloprotease [Paenibacillus sp. 481]
MLKRSLSVTMSVVMSLALLLPTVSAHGDDHGHDHEQPQIYFKDADGNKLLVDVLPKADPSKWNETLGSFEIERDVAASIIDETGNIVGTHQIEATVSEEESNATLATGWRNARVLIAVDEEYRAKHPNWRNKTAAILEAADDPFNREYNIDLTTSAYKLWNSNGADSAALLYNLTGSGNDPYDFVVGFTADPNFDAGGIAFVYNGKPRGAGYSVNLDQGDSATAYAFQHEISHNYGLGHDPQGSGIVCIMNYDYSYSTKTWDAAHKQTIRNNKHWFGR